MLSNPSRRSPLTAALLGLVVLSAACTMTPPPAPVAPPPPPVVPEEAPEYKNTLRWTTASEVDNFGFDVYRADHEDGPFERLTESPIPGAGTTDLTTDYAWEDHDIDPRRVYYYYVESISLQGVREQFTPIIRAKAKLPAAEASGSAAAPEDEAEPPVGDDSGSGPSR